MTFSTWLAFLAGVVIICGSPGPNMLKVMTTSARYGLRRAVFTMAGCFVPVFLMITASLLGVGAVLAVYPAAFDAIRYAGAAYLLYLGVGALRAAFRPSESVEASLDDVSPSQLFWHGFWVGLSNPKALLFATAFFPQFVDPNAPALAQFALLLGTFSVCEVVWYMFYALGGSRFTAAMKRECVRQRFEFCTGGLFIAFGAAMAVK